MSLRHATKASLRASCNRSTNRCRWSPQRTWAASPRNCCSRPGSADASSNWRGRTASHHGTSQRRSATFLGTRSGSTPFHATPGWRFSCRRACGIRCRASGCWTASTKGGSTSKAVRPARSRATSNWRPCCGSLSIGPGEIVTVPHTRPAYETGNMPLFFDVSRQRHRKPFNKIFRTDVDFVRLRSSSGKAVLFHRFCSTARLSPPKVTDDDIEALRPSFFLLLPEGSGRVVRERHAVRIPPAVEQQSSGAGGTRRAVAAEALSRARRRGPHGNRGDHHHRASWPLPSRTRVAAAHGCPRRDGGPQHGPLLRQ